MSDECKINEFSSAGCKRGTKGCEVEHAGELAPASSSALPPDVHNLPTPEDFETAYKKLIAPCSVEPTSRQVIENQLLAALDDKTKVAILADREDLDVMISALRKYRHRRAEQLSKDMQQLCDAAFPQNDRADRQQSGQASG